MNWFGWRGQKAAKVIAHTAVTDALQRDSGRVPNFHEEAAWPVGVKASMRRVGLRSGRLHYPDTDSDNLISWHRKNELAFACVEKIAQTATDPELIVEARVDAKASWERDDAHPLCRLFNRPNDRMDGAAFLARWLVMLHVTGTFRARIYRNDLKLPARLVPVLPPARLVPVVELRSGTPPLYYEYQDFGIREDVASADVFTDSLFDPRDEHAGLSPLAVALGAVDMDAAQTEYVRAYFNNGGVPSGIIKMKNVTLEEEEADGILKRWMRKYARGLYGKQVAPAVLDENADYQRIGANLNELASEALSERAEARVCAPFGVPPLLAGALVGLKNQNNRASAGAANKEFWENKMSPLLKRLRIHLTWTLLREFEGEDRIAAGLVRVNWDLSQVSAMKEDVDAVQKRARENLKAGGITLDQFLEKIGEKPLEGKCGQVYYVPSNIQIVRADELGQKPEEVEGQLDAGAPKMLPAGDKPLEVAETM
ncbi:MAG TPA: phage portal protein [Pyrinomonadaceae bacterium]